MKKSKKLLSLILCFVLALSLGVFALTACSDDNKGTANGPLSVSSVKIEIGKGTMITSKENAQWTVDDESIASITTIPPGAPAKMCNVTGVGVGTTNVTATLSNGKKYVVKVTVTERNVLTIKAAGQEVTGDLNLEEAKTLQLSATSNIGSKKFKWESSNPRVATVSNSGLVKGVFPGKTTITVKVDGDETTYASVNVNVTAKEGSEKYLLQMAEKSGTQYWSEPDADFVGDKVTMDTYFMWHSRAAWGQQTITFDNAPQYNNGVISFKYTSDWDPGLWFGMQIIYKNSEHEVGKNYKLNCKINIKSASLVHNGTEEEKLDKVKVTLNGNVIELNKGVNNVEVYFVYSSPIGVAGISSFDLAMGWEDPSEVNGWFVQNADVEISDVSWTKDTPIDLKTPSFTYENNKIVVDDPNTEGVECYRALFYQDGKQVGASTLKNGEPFDTSALNKGEYTVKIQAVGKNAHYNDSDISTDQTTITVTEDASYTLTKNGSATEALDKPGTWAYWAQTWVVVNARHSAGVTTLEFTNNAGMFDALQLYYKNPTNVAGTKYKLSVDIELKGNDQGGHITLSGSTRTLEPGMNHVEVVYVEENGAASFAMLVARWPNEGDINDGTLVISNYKWEEFNGDLVSIGAPTNAKVTTDEPYIITFDEVEHAYNGYEVGFFKDGATEPTASVMIDESGEELELGKLRSGTYTVKVRALSDGKLYAAVGAWSDVAGTIKYSNPNGDDAYELETGDGATASANRGTWVFWTEYGQGKDGGKLTPSYANGKVTMSFSNNQGNWYNLQLFIDPEMYEAGKTYEVSFTIKVENALITNDGITGGSDYNPNDHKAEGATNFLITVSGQEKEIEVGEHTYTFTITKEGPIQFLFAVNPESHGNNTFNHISAGDITISDPVIVAK